MNLLPELRIHFYNHVIQSLYPLLSTDDRSPIQHELFHKFLQYRDTADPPWGAQDALLTWQEKRHPWLELNMVNRETTNGIRVTAVSYYMGCKDNQQGKKYWVSQLVIF